MGNDTAKLPERGAAVSLDLYLKLLDVVRKLVGIIIGISMIVNVYKRA